MEYVVITEHGETVFEAYVPNLPGCIAAGEIHDKGRDLIAEAIRFHIEDMGSHGDLIPRLSSSTELVRVA